jgi:hypothetical protein
VTRDRVYQAYTVEDYVDVEAYSEDEAIALSYGSELEWQRFDDGDLGSSGYAREAIKRPEYMI